MQTDNLKRASEDLVDCRTQLTLMTWICQCSMTNTSEKYERTQQRNLLMKTPRNNKKWCIVQSSANVTTTFMLQNKNTPRRTR